MRLENAEQVRIDAEKIKDYLLSSSHPIGRFKEVFFSSLGFRRQQWDRLDVALREHVLSGQVESQIVTDYGKKYVVRGILRGPWHSASVVSVWFVRVGEEVPRFVTAYPGD